MAALPLLLRQRLVGDAPDEILEESVLAALGGAGVRVHAHDLLPHERAEEGLEFGVGEPADGHERLPREGLAEDGGVLDRAPLVMGEPVQAGGDEGMQRLRHVEPVDLARGPVEVALTLQESAVEQHPHRLHRVQRHAFRAGHDPPVEQLRQAGRESVEQLLHGTLRERLEIDGGEASQSGTPGGPPLLELGATERHHVDRVVARPLEQVFDEVEQARVRPLHVLEGEHDGTRVGQALEEEPPGREHLLAVAARTLLEAEEMGEPRLDEGSLLLVVQVLDECRAQLLAGRVGTLFLGDPAAHANHVRQRPVGDAVSVGEATSAVPPDLLDDPVEVLVELPHEPRLAGAGNAGDRDEVRLPVLGGGVEEVLQQLELALAADERSLQAGGLQGPSAAGDDTERPPQRDRLGLALELVKPRLVVRDRLPGRPSGRLSDEHRAGFRGGLDSRGRVDEVPGDHALAFRADRHGGLAGQYAAARVEVRIEVGHRRHEVEGGAHGALGVVLGCGRRAPDGHDCVADELLDGAAVSGDQRPSEVEVVRKELPDLLRVARLGKGGEADQVGKENRDEPALGRRTVPDGRRRSRGRRTSVSERGSAFHAERVTGLVRAAARRAGQPERVTALRAELRALPIRRTTVGTFRHCSRAYS